MEQQQQQQQHQHQQQQLLLQQIQRRNEAVARFPSNIDAHLRPQQAVLHQRPPPQIPNHPTPNPNPIPNPNPNANAAAAAASANSNTPQHFKASLQLSYQDAWRVCHPDYSRPFSSLEDACHRLLPYHVVADYEAEEDDKILDSDSTGQVLSRSQQWDHNIAAKVAEFTTTFEKQVLAFNMIYRKRGLGEFRTEEKLMMEQFLLNEEKQALFELKAKMDSRQKVSRETHEANMRMAAMVQMEQARAESQAHAEMMARPPIRASTIGSRGGNISSLGPDIGGGQDQDDMINEDDKEPSEDFLNDDETENGDTSMQSEWHGEGKLDLNAR
ncbi:uncharacterized protein LOC142532799 isoform X2 [Primulina tabacum]|uniref:uncharacterized protein LOC142532799 isoform X2 n=1 Tax=Primulina tabacum TaxID=48773 RepID=UPI003F5A93F1